MALPVWEIRREGRWWSANHCRSVEKGTCTARMTGGKKGGWRSEAGD
jgi:hypothetical protein